MANTKEEKQIKPNDNVEIEFLSDMKGKGSAVPFIKKGDKATVHSVQADKLVAAGKAKIVGEEKKGGK